ncbi:hypothetical protein K435DRAFT_825693 [Dendrothele bispora CBS 962.96]|uniref:Uncharacterized protein n=1 Tax=Dendrothele bispora (strain CBS 962.96) TaxID=1314807 RepID=A0A4S8MV40_DENBC|nr:hypothetical protein K435DRAFT_825693 [Dendrothele bispora CBS 962.96]
MNTYSLPSPAFPYPASGKPVCETCDINPFNVPPTANGGYFAFAKVKKEVCLVQVSTPTSALTTVDVKIFRHEFVTIFRLSEARTLHPSDIQILEPIDDQLKCYEEDTETVFLAKTLTERLRTLTLPPRFTSHHRSYYP